ncbi:MAG: alginate export family protein, partial [Phycisphaerae bacterium]|nr:alginate export family protein [Phycisphaerae bacterium]
FAAPVRAQDRSGRDVYKEHLRVQLDEQVPSAREVGFDAGGWFSFAFFNYDDPVDTKKRTLRQFQLRAWANLNIRGEHQFYFRGLVGWDDWNKGDNPLARGDEDTDPEVERAWYQLDLGQILRNRTGKAPAIGLKVKAGRAYAEIGTALALSMPLDMVQFNVTAGEWELMALLGKSLTNSRNIDDSEPVTTHQERCFWGIELAYTGFDQHRPFVYYLQNDDHTAAKPEVPAQSFEYSSRYLGVGSTGSLILPDLRYQTELVWEWGKTYSNDVVYGRDKICAMAYDLLLEYLFQTRLHPKVSVEYLFATGDSDRQTSATATVGGNTQGTRDNAFNAFGFRDTGLAFAPRVSNLHIYTVGASFFPLEEHELFRKMELGTKAFFYHKASGDGPISDTTATNNAQWVGWEWDIFCDWRITSDLTWTIRYGAFQPGGA